MKCLHPLAVTYLCKLVESDIEQATGRRTKCASVVATEYNIYSLLHFVLSRL